MCIKRNLQEDYGLGHMYIFFFLNHSLFCAVWPFIGTKEISRSLKMKLSGGRFSENSLFHCSCVRRTTGFFFFFGLSLLFDVNFCVSDFIS